MVTDPGMRVSCVMRRSMPSHSIFTCTGGAAPHLRPPAASGRLRLRCRGLGLRFGVDVAIVGVLLDGLQRDAVELRGGAVEEAMAGAPTPPISSSFLPSGVHLAPRDQELVGADHVLLAAGQFLDLDVGAQQLVLLGVGDALAIGRELRPPMLPASLCATISVLPLSMSTRRSLWSEPVHSSDFESGAQTSDLVAIGVAELLEGLAQLVGDPDFLAAGAVGNEGDPLAVGRPARVLLLPGGLGDALQLAAIGGDGEDLAVRGDGRAPVRGREAEALGFGDGDEFLVVLFGSVFTSMRISVLLPLATSSFHMPKLSS